MSSLQLPRGPHWASRALVALAAFSGHKITVSDADVQEPTFVHGGNTVSGAEPVAEAIVPKSNALWGQTAQQESVASWVRFAASFPQGNGASQTEFKKLDDSLRLATFLAGAAPTVADLFVYSAVYHPISVLNNVERFHFANATRWFDHVQHQHALHAHRDRLAIIPIKRNVSVLLQEKTAIEKGKPAERQHKAEEHKPKHAAAGKHEEPKDVAAPAAAGAAAPAPAAAKGDGKKKEKAAAKPAAEGKPAAPKGKGKGEPPAAAQSDISKLEIKVGRIVEVKQHTDNLYAEKIDLGEAAPRSILSGLVKFVPIEQMQNRLVLVLCNLAPREMQGIRSEGMVLAASDEAHTTVELLVVPEGSTLGERVTFPGETAEPERPHLNRKVLDRVFVDLKTNDEGVASYKGALLSTSKGVVRSATLKNAHIK